MKGRPSRGRKGPKRPRRKPRAVAPATRGRALPPSRETPARKKMGHRLPATRFQTNLYGVRMEVVFLKPVGGGSRKPGFHPPGGGGLGRTPWPLTGVRGSEAGMARVCESKGLSKRAR